MRELFPKKRLDLVADLLGGKVGDGKAIHVVRPKARLGRTKLLIIREQVVIKMTPLVLDAGIAKIQMVIACTVTKELEAKRRDLSGSAHLGTALEQHHTRGFA